VTKVATHQEILDGIERRLAATAAGPCEVDERVAGELGVCVEDYFAYVVVAGAIERYADVWQRQLPIGDVPRAQESLGQVWELADAIASAAATICLETADESHRQVNLAGAWIYSATVQLCGRLRHLEGRLAGRAFVDGERAALTAAARLSEGVVGDGR
jgi:hypothetical protein